MGEKRQLVGIFHVEKLPKTTTAYDLWARMSTLSYDTSFIRVNTYPRFQDPIYCFLDDDLNLVGKEYFDHPEEFDLSLPDMVRVDELFDLSETIFIDKRFPEKTIYFEGNNIIELRDTDFLMQVGYYGTFMDKKKATALDLKNKMLHQVLGGDEVAYNNWKLVQLLSNAGTKVADLLKEIL